MPDRWINVQFTRTWNFRILAKTRREAQEILDDSIARDGLDAEDYNNTSFPRRPAETYSEIQRPDKS